MKAVKKVCSECRMDQPVEGTLHLEKCSQHEPATCVQCIIAGQNCDCSAEHD